MRDRLSCVTLLLLAAPAALAADMRKERCAKDPHAIYQVSKRGDSVWYAFCDGAQVKKTADGKFKLAGKRVSADQSTQAADELAAMQVAEHNDRVLHTEATSRRAAQARAAYEAKMRKITGGGWTADRSVSASKSSKLPVEE